MACLDAFGRSRHEAVLADDIRRSRQEAGDQQVPEDEDERLRALTDAARQSHFSPVRARKRLLDLP